MADTFEQFLTSRWRHSLARHRVLCIYDSSARYRDIALCIADAKTRVIEVAGDVITAREQAMDAWRKLPEDVSHTTALVIYMQRARPLTDDDQRDDPFTPLALGGAAFPDGAGDEYAALCEQFLPEQKAAIEELFAQDEPPIALINGLVSGKESSPALVELLKAEGTKEILVKFLCLAPAGKKKLKAAAHWLKELKALTTKTLGLTLHGDEADADDLRGQLWRYVLFSEFAADLPGGLPAALTAVPRAAAKHERFVMELCAALRDSGSAQPFYEEFANKTADELNLGHHCQGIEDLGRLDTFAFEERSFLRCFAKTLLADEFEAAEALLKERSKSFWIRDAERAAQWKLAACCLNLRMRLSQLAVAIKMQSSRNVPAWIEFYVTEFCRADSFHRELEQVAQEAGTEGSPLDESLGRTRDEYRQLADRVARLFQTAVAQDGWPASGLPRATEMFERFVRPPWQQGKRVAYFWVDALRYELAQLLETALSGRHGVSIRPVCAQLPTVTKIGMAALLPGAETDLKLMVSGGEVTPTIKGQPVMTVTDRFKLLQDFVGPNRTKLVDLEDLAAPTFSDDLAAVEVLVVKTSDIDLQGENNPGYFIRVLPAVIRNLQLALNRLAGAGFNLAIITADHGFCWFHEANAGSSISKPVGEWVQVKERSLLGSGQNTADVIVVDATHVGIRGDVAHYVAAKGLATFSKGVRYFHEGLSLQECVLPLMLVELRAASPTASAAPVRLVVTYRGASSGKVTTLRPSIEISYPETDLFGPVEVRFLLEGFDSTGKKIAEAAASPNVDAGTKEVAIAQAKAIKVPIKIEEGFEGEFELRAINRETAEIYATLKLATDFHH